jgi:glycerate 2-kinase
MSKTHHPQWIHCKEQLHAIAQAALAAVNPFDAVQRFLQIDQGNIRIGSEEYFLDEDAKVYVVGAGKAGVSMAQAVESILGKRITDGVIAVPEFAGEPLSTIQFIEGGHPLPTEGSIEAGKKVADLLKKTVEGDLVLVLISGGGSALLELPLEGLHLSDLQQVNELLLRSGAPIQEINTVRKQLSRIKGGGLGSMAAPAKTAALILSDVVGDPLDVIASGPTVRSETSIKDAWTVLQRYDLLSKVPGVLKEILERFSDEVDTKPATQLDINNLIIGSNRTAAEAAAKFAQEVGFQSFLLTTMLQGEARQIGSRLANLVKALKLPFPNGKPLCMLLGGETTVTVHGRGVGGRNQELALAAAIELEGVKNVMMMTLATDGIDGPTPSAGAIVTGETVVRARELGLDPDETLSNNDSHSFFRELGDNVDLGLTGTNVNDLILICVYNTQEAR